MFLFKNSSISTFSASSLVLLSVTMLPAVLNSLSEGTVVHRGAKYFRAKVASKGHDACFSFQYSSGLLCWGALLSLR